MDEQSICVLAKIQELLFIFQSSTSTYIKNVKEGKQKIT